MSSPGEFVLHHSEWTVHIVQETSLAIDSKPTVQPYQQGIDLTEDEGSSVTAHGVWLQKDEQLLASCLLVANRGATGIHPRSALLHDDRCIIAVSDYVCALHLPDLELLWATKSDWITCFGVIHSPRHGCYISHGELEIARLDYDGKTEWSASGPDIFTGNIELCGDHVEVFDFNDDKFAFNLETGD